MREIGHVLRWGAGLNVWSATIKQKQLMLRGEEYDWEMVLLEVK